MAPSWGLNFLLCKTNVLVFNSRCTEVLPALYFRIHIFPEGKYCMLLFFLIPWHLIQCWSQIQRLSSSRRINSRGLTSLVTSQPYSFTTHPVPHSIPARLFFFAPHELSRLDLPWGCCTWRFSPFGSLLKYLLPRSLWPTCFTIPRLCCCCCCCCSHSLKLSYHLVIYFLSLFAFYLHLLCGLSTSPSSPSIQASISFYIPSAKIVL